MAMYAAAVQQGVQFGALALGVESAATTAAELETDFTRDGFTTEKSIINSKALRKITNLIYKQKAS